MLVIYGIWRREGGQGGHPHPGSDIKRWGYHVIRGMGLSTREVGLEREVTS